MWFRTSASAARACAAISPWAAALQAAIEHLSIRLPKRRSAVVIAKIANGARDCYDAHVGTTPRPIDQGEERTMRRFIALFVGVIFALGAFAAPAMAQATKTE